MSDTNGAGDLIARQIAECERDIERTRVKASEVWYLTHLMLTEDHFPGKLPPDREQAVWAYLNAHPPAVPAEQVQEAITRLRSGELFFNDHRPVNGFDPQAHRDALRAELARLTGELETARTIFRETANTVDPIDPAKFAAEILAATPGPSIAEIIEEFDRQRKG